MSLFARFRPLRPDRAELRSIVDRLPLAVRIAMLDGVRAERIIAGGYADGTGGICPMLAAHRHGARWSFPDFARTWDEFAGAPAEGLRDASPEDVAALAAVLSASIEDDLRVDASIPDGVTPAGVVAARTTTPRPARPVPAARRAPATDEPAAGVDDEQRVADGRAQRMFL